MRWSVEQDWQELMMVVQVTMTMVTDYKRNDCNTFMPGLADT